MNKIFIFLLSYLAIVQYTKAADTYVTGNITQITSITEGLLIKLEEGNLPNLCKNKTAFGWMLIPQSRKTIIAVTLSQWYQKKRNVTVYVDSDYTNNKNYCTIKQVAPI